MPPDLPQARQPLTRSQKQYHYRLHLPPLYQLPWPPASPPLIFIYLLLSQQLLPLHLVDCASIPKLKPDGTPKLASKGKGALIGAAIGAGLTLLNPIFTAAGAAAGALWQWNKRRKQKKALKAAGHVMYAHADPNNMGVSVGEAPPWNISFTLPTFSTANTSPLARMATRVKSVSI